MARTTKKKQKNNDNQSSKLKNILFKLKNTFEVFNNEDIEKFSNQYIDFINKNRTEWETIFTIEEILKSKKIPFFKKHEKSLIAYKINNKKDSNFKIIVSHVDSPRLDLKPRIFNEKYNLCYLATQYYGGIKKYQWLNQPLSLRGLVYKNNKTIIIKEKGFIIPDVHAHTSSEQLKKQANKFIEGELMKVLCGSKTKENKKIKDTLETQDTQINKEITPIQNPISYDILRILNKKYNITETDLIFSEIQLVPNNKVQEIGFDNSLIAGYGQDDRICVFTSLMAFLDSKPKHNIAVIFIDKEEIGSEGNTSVQSRFIENSLKKIYKKLLINTNFDDWLENIKVISADVTTAIDLISESNFDPNNSSRLNNGIVIEKYTGSGGKYYSNEADYKFASKLKDILDKRNIPWQTGSIGKIDLGGGGTVAMFLARLGCDVIDMGPALLSMHAPYEISSKGDLFGSYMAYKAFFEDF